ncbi:MAG: redox-regulated ATPase YchF [Candidatus Atribacteria bacterium]|nr:redox-regulated ATPase YchF [Candidatus Atribacteria bacterium]
MKIGMFGLPLTGKTTIFSLLAGIPYDSSYKTEADEKISRIKDERLDTLAKIYNPLRIVYATLDFVDIPSFDMTADKKEKNKIFQMIQNVDALLLVIRAFRNDQVPFPFGAETPQQQLEALRTELIIRDMEVVENRILRLQEQKRKKKPTLEEEREEILLGLIQKELEDSNFASRLQLTTEDKKLLGSLACFTLKPIITVVNVDEEQLMEDNFPGKKLILDECTKQNFAFLIMSGKIESELIDLDEEARKDFMAELGIQKSGIQRLAQVVFDHIGYISFFTVGKDEVRSWTIERGATMKTAAAKIHTDLARGFIKAEVIKFSDFIRLKSEEKVKQAGLWKLAGKDEIVEDADIITIRSSL